MADNPSGATGRGRPRSETARKAILAAARELLAASDRVSAVTADAIAARARVSKGTIYRWWPGSAAVVMDAFLIDTNPHIPFPDTGSVREDLRLQLRTVVELFNGPTGRTIAGLIAASQNDPRLAAAFAERFIAARRAMCREVFERGVARGELRPEIDIDIAIDALYGALYYRLLVSHANSEPGYVDNLIEQLYPALAAEPGTPRAERAAAAEAAGPDS